LTTLARNRNNGSKMSLLSYKREYQITTHQKKKKRGREKEDLSYTQLFSSVADVLSVPHFRIYYSHVHCKLKR
ncbi:hypothetical protein L9F63_013465, partial [Diploptera punctata]